MLRVRLHGEGLEEHDGNSIIENALPKHEHVEGGAKVHAVEDGQSGNGVDTGNEGAECERMAQGQGDGEAEEASVIHNGPDCEAGDDGAEHGKGKDAADEREELRLVKAVAGIKYDRRKQIDEERLRVERDEKAYLFAVEVQVGADDKAEENSSHRLREDMELGQQQRVRQE